MYGNCPMDSKISFLRGVMETPHMIGRWVGGWEEEGGGDLLLCLKKRGDSNPMNSSVF